MTRETDMMTLGSAAKQASAQIRLSSTETRNNALKFMATEIRGAEANILQANAQDMAAATEKHLSAAMLDRLKLDPARVAINLGPSPMAFSSAKFVFQLASLV